MTIKKSYLSHIACVLDCGSNDAAFLVKRAYSQAAASSLSQAFESIGNRREEFVPRKRNEGCTATERAGASQSIPTYPRLPQQFLGKKDCLNSIAALRHLCVR